jgi:hypothetical protein
MRRVRTPAKGRFSVPATSAQWCGVVSTVRLCCALPSTSRPTPCARRRSEPLSARATARLPRAYCVGRIYSFGGACCGLRPRPSEPSAMASLGGASWQPRFAAKTRSAQLSLELNVRALSRVYILISSSPLLTSPSAHLRCFLLSLLDVASGR